MKTAEIKIGKAIRNEKGDGVGVILTSGQRLYISKFEYINKANIDGVLHKVPSEKSKHLKKVGKTLSLRPNGEVVEIQENWRDGIIVAGKLVTRVYYYNPNFGKYSVSRIEVLIRENKETGEKNIIINYYPTKKEATLALKTPGEIIEGITLFQEEIPGTSEKIVVNRI